MIENPSRNVLGAGFSMEKIEAAIAKSGYPLQTHVANTLRALHFDISPEWSFIDRDTADLRSMDIRATLDLYEDGDKTRSRPSLTLIIECKQSEMPFVFFTGETMAPDTLLPFIAGQKRDDFTIYTDDTASIWSCDLQKALSLRGHRFFSSPPVAYNFSKCQRKSGSELLLSGDETYHGLIMPLVKSLYHLKVAERPPTTAVYFDIHYAIALGIIDAPMVAYEGTMSKLIPWVRVLRHEAGNAELGKNDRGSVIPVDIIHRDFLETYVSNHLLPAARDFAIKILAHSVEAADGEGFITGMDTKWYTDWEAHLQPRPRSLGRRRSSKFS